MEAVKLNHQTKFLRHSENQGIHPRNRSGVAPVKKGQFTPIATRGTIVPWNKEVISGFNCEYKIITPSGAEYFLMADDDWKPVLRNFVWMTVRLKGDLNVHTMTVFPREIDLDGPIENKAKVISFKKERNKILKKLSSFGGIITILPKVAQF